MKLVETKQVLSIILKTNQIIELKPVNDLHEIKEWKEIIERYVI